MGGIIGSATAVVHGVLTQRLMVRPIAAFLQSDARISAPVRRIAPLALHFSTITWFLGGLALIAAAADWFEPNARRAVGICIGSLFLLGALGNFWGTRGRHPGWMLMILAVILIVFGISARGD